MYGQGLADRLAADLTANYGRGFSQRNVEQMRAFYLGWSITQTPSGTIEARVNVPAVPDGSASRKKRRHRLRNFHSLTLI